jgi:serine/threonine-protein kinase HipA
MNLEINNCPSTLQLGFSSYSPIALKNLFGQKKVSHILPYSNPNQDDETKQVFNENRKHISISGVQDKLSLILEKSNLRLTKDGEKGQYILKPIPVDLLKVNQVPANEHLTMQIAAQVYGIKTAVNGLIFFNDNSPAYITKRFDRKADGMGWGKEDFASLAGKTVQNDGVNYKYNYSYEAIGSLIQKYVSAWQVDIEGYFRLIVFNYLFSNGDAHLKNFALLENPSGDYSLSPAYDLINTRIHVDDTDFALSKGLFEDDFQSDYFKRSNHACSTDFKEFAKRIGIKPNRIDFLLNPFFEKHDKIETLIANSFLDNKSKKTYWQMYLTKLNQLKSV